MISEDIRNTVGVVARQVEAETLTELMLLRALKLLLVSADEVAILESHAVPATERNVRVTPLSPGIPACATRRGEVVRPEEDFWKRGRS